MKVIAIVAQKGGAKKSTLVMNLAVAGMDDDKETMAIDLDPQASTAKWGIIRKKLHQEAAPVVLSAHASMLPEYLEKASANGADLVFIDTGATSNNAALTAARSADLVVIPTSTGILDLQIVSESVDVARLANKPAVIVITDVPEQGHTAEDVRAALKTLGTEISPYVTTHRATYPNSQKRGLAVQEYKPNSIAAREIRQLYNWILTKVG
jgi:chromosome partitioning protein